MGAKDYQMCVAGGHRGWGISAARQPSSGRNQCNQQKTSTPRLGPPDRPGRRTTSAAVVSGPISLSWMRWQSQNDITCDQSISMTINCAFKVWWNMLAPIVHAEPDLSPKPNRFAVPRYNRMLPICYSQTIRVD